MLDAAAPGFYLNMHQVLVTRIFMYGKGSENMSRRKRRKSRSAKEEQQKNEKRNGLSLTSFLKSSNLKSMSSQLHDIADHMEKFGEMAEIFTLFESLANTGQSKEKNFNLMNLIKDKDSLNHILQAVMPAIQNHSEEKKVEPINVETFNSK